GWVTHVLELPIGRVDIPPSPPASGGEGTGVRGVEYPLLQEPPSPWPSPPETGGEGEKQLVTHLPHGSVAHGDRPILTDVTWAVRPGERWAVLGPNGSGKSTLLSLLCGDHPQAYRNEIYLFGRRRGSGESIWDIKRRIGLVSPELHLY